MTRQALEELPARRSNFSRPFIFLMSITSPVPWVPYFPFRRTRARLVVGFSSGCRFPDNFGALGTICLGPTGTRTLEDDPEVDLVLELGGIVEVKGEPELTIIVRMQRHRVSFGL
jgi:hypothetical protein